MFSKQFCSENFEEILWNEEKIQENIEEIDS